MGEIELREYIDLQIRHERELREVGERSAAQALELQAVEYERRLQILNHNHDAVKDLVNQTVSAIEWKGYRAERDKWERGVSTQLDRYAGALATMSVILALLSVALRFLP